MEVAVMINLMDASMLDTTSTVVECGGFDGF